MVENKLMTTEEAARYLGVEPETVRRWVRNKIIPFLRINKLIRIQTSDLNQFIKSRVVMPKEDGG